MPAPNATASSVRLLLVSQRPYRAPERVVACRGARHTRTVAQAAREVQSVNYKALTTTSDVSGLFSWVPKHDRTNR